MLRDRVIAPDYPEDAETGTCVRWLSDAIGRYDDSFSTYVIVTHDSAICGASPALEEYFNDLPLKQWRLIGFRQPYIGLITKGGRAYEFLGDKEERVTIHFKNIVDGESMDVLRRVIDPTVH